MESCTAHAVCSGIFKTLLGGLRDVEVVVVGVLRALVRVEHGIALGRFAAKNKNKK